MDQLSPNTQAILLLTAPLISGDKENGYAPLKPSEYRTLARILRQSKREPADLLGAGAEELLAACAPAAGPERLRRLLQRGFALARAVERWEARSIWVVSRADAAYPARLKERLREDAPPVLYGAGDADLTGGGGLAVVGSRKVDDELLRFAEDAGRLVARAGRPLVSGGARGVDETSMRGAAEEGGTVVGVLADRLERAAIERDNRSLLMDGRLVLISPYDPSAGFNVGHAMQRNKLIYALSDAALVVNADLNKGGTWAGAVEQLEKLHLVPVYVRSNGSPNRALEALVRKGARPWPDPASPEELNRLLSQPAAPQEEQLSLSVRESEAPGYDSLAADVQGGGAIDASAGSTPAERLMSTVRALIEEMPAPMTVKDVAAGLDVPESQARAWLERLVAEGILEKRSRPVRYERRGQAGDLFSQGD